MHLRVYEAASLCIRPRVSAADGPVYALWPSGYGSAVHAGLLFLLTGFTMDEISLSDSAELL